MNVDYKAIAERVWQQWPSASHVDTDVVIDIYNELKSEMQSDGLLPERRTTEQELYKILASSRWRIHGFCRTCHHKR